MQLYVAAKQPPSPMQPSPHRALAALGSTGDFAGTQAPATRQQQHRPVRLRQRRDRPQQSGAQVRLGDGLGRVSRDRLRGIDLTPSGRGRLQDPVQRVRNFPSPQLPALVGGDAVEPGAQTGLAPEVIQMQGGLEEGRLGDILGILTMAAQLPCQPVDISAVLPQGDG